jgi:hypothetical protein
MFSSEIPGMIGGGHIRSYITTSLVSSSSRAVLLFSSFRTSAPSREEEKQNQDPKMGTSLALASSRSQDNRSFAGSAAGFFGSGAKEKTPDPVCCNGHRCTCALAAATSTWQHASMGPGDRRASLPASQLLEHSCALELEMLLDDALKHHARLLQCVAWCGR